MPWLETCINCLPKDMNSTDILTALTFIGLIQNRDYISFSVLANLIAELPITQQQLQCLYILSPLLLLNSPKVHRLHDSVPYKVPISQPLLDKPATTARHTRTPSPQQSDPDTYQQEEPQDQVIERVQTRTVPANITRWTDEEVELVIANPQMTHSDAYQAYLKKCQGTWQACTHIWTHK